MPGPGPAPGPASGSALRPPRSAPGTAAQPRAASALVPVLRALAAQPRVVRAQEALDEATAALRWNEALRRRWREARAEASVRCAVASGAVEGAPVPASLLREHVAAADLTRPTSADPALDAVAGIWRAGTRLVAWMPDLRGDLRPTQPSARTLLATLHRDVTGPLASAGVIPLGEVGAPREEAMPLREGGPGDAPRGGALAARLDPLLELIEAPGLPALVRAAVVHGELITVRPFTSGNAAVARLVVRHLVTRDGLEPTGTAVADQYAAQAPGAYSAAARAYASGTSQGVTDWILWQAEALLVGVTEAQALCRAVQAGTTA
ncbi:Fic family protein [Actinomyces sp. HMT897]|nr:Fic family protein [Actinomyces sp. HMT897]